CLECLQLDLGGALLDLRRGCIEPGNGITKEAVSHPEAQGRAQTKAKLVMSTRPAPRKRIADVGVVGLELAEFLVTGPRPGRPEQPFGNSPTPPPGAQPNRPRIRPSVRAVRMRTP